MGIALLAAGAARAEPSDNKWQYTLFNPTPDRLLREFTTDRPDTTEGAFTVDAGHVQFETNVFGYSRSFPDKGVVTRAYEIGTTNTRIGLTNNVELDLIYQPYGIVRTSGPSPSDNARFSGSGPLDIRTKINLWGNDSFEKPGSTAFALLPFISLPTRRGNGISPDGVEGGLILPYAIKLTDKLDLGLNTGIHIVHNDDAPGYHREYLASASFGYDWTDALGTYYEIAARFHTPLGEAVTFGTGVTYKLSKNFQIDAGINIGLTHAADRINPFVGISMRF
jgi:hypothetical protein